MNHLDKTGLLFFFFFFLTDKLYSQTNSYITDITDVSVPQAAETDATVWHSGWDEHEHPDR